MNNEYLTPLCWFFVNNKITKIKLRASRIIIVFIILEALVKYGHAEDDIYKFDLKNNHNINKHDIKYLIFSSTKYQRERKLVRMHEHINPNSNQLKSGKIYIAIANLDGNGAEEIFSYIDIYEFCGEIGCALNIYQIHNQSLTSLLPSEFDPGGFPISIKFDEDGHQKVIGILQSKEKGWHDILLYDETIWKWNGKNYGKQ